MSEPAQPIPGIDYDPAMPADYSPCELHGCKWKERKTLPPICTRCGDVVPAEIWERR